MHAYTYSRPRSVRDAVAQAETGAAFLAGGTTLVDLMKLDVMTPAHVMDINRLPLRGITVDGGGLHIGALERMSDVAAHRAVREAYPMIAEALELSASGQLRNMASIGGNLLQRTRCGYFRDITTPCNKREPGSGCSALTGVNRIHAILGTSDACVATNPSDLAVALVALDTDVHLVSVQGTRTVPLDTFYTLPGTTPHIENVLRPGELITGITVPHSRLAANSLYLKIRDRQSFEFALASAAVALELKNGTIRDARVALGGVATVPWRAREAEALLKGQKFDEALAQRVAEAAFADARGRRHNSFKIALGKRVVARALQQAVTMEI